MNSKIWVSVIFLIGTFCFKVNSQEFIPLWPKGKMPNSKGIVVKDSVSDERYRQVGTPGLLAYFTSKQENKHVAVIICPGGGYKHYAYEVSGIQVAKWLNTIGINAFVLLSRLPHSPDLEDRTIGPLQDAQRAIRIIRSNSIKWGIDTSKVGVIGFSAGGHLASTIGTHFTDVSNIGDSADLQQYAPDFMVLISPVISMGKLTHKGSRENLLGKTPSQELIDKFSNELQVTSKTPPAFIVCADNDPAVSPLNSLLFYQALHEKGVKASIHIFNGGGHNIALRNNPLSTNYWSMLCEDWLIELGFITGSTSSK